MCDKQTKEKSPAIILSMKLMQEEKSNMSGGNDEREY
jgi:hypothetical protein